MRQVSNDPEFILAIDPGGHTGLAWRYDGVFGCDVVDGGRFGFHNWFIQSIDKVATPTQVVIEDFIITSATARKTAQPDPYRIIGWVELWCHQHGVPFETQTPATGKGFGTDAKLKHLGWYSTGKGGHDMDAARHLLTFLARTRDETILDQLRTFNV